MRGMHRRLPRWLIRVLAMMIAAGLLLLAYGMLIEPRRLIERDHALSLPHWPRECDGLRIDAVSDIHTGSFGNGLDNLDRVVARLAASDSDVVVLLGDYVIFKVLFGGYVSGDEMAPHLRPLIAKKRVYGVLGNHDWWKGGPAVRDAFAAAGVRMIDNRAETLQLGDCRLWLVGIGDALEGHPDIAGAFAQVSDGAPVIALTHEPSLFPRIPARAALTVAGHTHGGQIDPWPVSLIGEGRFDPGSHRLRGAYEVDGRLLFVTPGIGTSILPMRLGVPPEISRLTLRSTQARGAMAARTSH